MSAFWESIKKQKEKEIIIIFVVFLFLFAVIINFCPFLYNSINSKDAADATQEINAWFYFLSGAGTAALAVIAYLKIGKINKQSRIDFLLRIDERWGNAEIIKARTTIHELYLQVQKENKNTIATLRNALDARENYIQLKIGEKIIEYAKEESRKDEFLHLLNFLDFMETIGYMANEEQVTVKELEALCGESLMFNYKIFKPYIEDKRERHQQPEFYENFDKLYKKLEKESKPQTL